VDDSYSKAKKNTHQATIAYSADYKGGVLQPSLSILMGAKGLEANSDQDIAGYLNLKYKTDFRGTKLRLRRVDFIGKEQRKL
jgi:hypothetical protein